MLLEIKGISSLSHYHLELKNKMITSKNERKTCPICSSSKGEIYYQVIFGSNHENKNSNLSKVICMKCGHSYFDKFFNTEISNKFYINQWDHSVQDTSIKQNVKPNYSEWSPIHHIMDMKIKKTALILDFGCGYGDSLKALQTKGYKNFYGIEIGSSRARIAEHNFPGKVINGNEDSLKEMVKKTGKFDLIYSNHVFEHLADPLSVLKKLNDSLSEHGLLVISVPAPGSETIIHSAIYYPHFHCYSPQSLKLLMKKIGRSSLLWNKSNYQLAVIGYKKKTNLSSKKFECIKPSPLPTINKLNMSFSDGFNQLSNLSFGLEVLNFCHPKTNFLNKKSGLVKLTNFGKNLLFITDIFIKTISLILSNKAILFLKKVYRSIFYRLKIFPSVDNIYVKKMNVENKKSNSKAKITFFSSDGKVLLGK